MSTRVGSPQPPEDNIQVESRSTNDQLLSSPGPAPDQGATDTEMDVRPIPTEQVGYTSQNTRRPRHDDGVEVRGILQLVTSASSDDILSSTDLDVTQIMEKCTSVIKESEEISMGLINLKHHQKVMKEAINNRKPPNGLIPKVKVSAQDSNRELEDTINQILTSAGLNICKALQDHYESVFADKQLDNASVNLKLENLVTSVPQGPDKERVLKHINDKVQLVKNKIGKRKQQLASRFAKKQPAESGDDEDEPRPKRARPNTPTDGDIETLRDKVERVSNNTNPYVTHPDIMPPAARSSSGHLEPRERPRKRPRQGNKQKKRAGKPTRA